MSDKCRCETYVKDCPVCFPPAEPKCERCGHDESTHVRSGRWIQCNGGYCKCEDYHPPTTEPAESEYDEILARTDCFLCGADAMYEKSGSLYKVDCVNIDCRCSEGVTVRSTLINADRLPTATPATTEPAESEGKACEECRRPTQADDVGFDFGDGRIACKACTESTEKDWEETKTMLKAEGFDPDKCDFIERTLSRKECGTCGKAIMADHERVWVCMCDLNRPDSWPTRPRLDH